MSEHIHKGHLHHLKEEHGRAVPCCSPRELELESERDQLREEVARLKAEQGTFYVDPVKEALVIDRDHWKSLAAKMAVPMQNFIDKVDRGEARSFRSYEAFKAVIALYNASRGDEGKKDA